MKASILILIFALLLTSCSKKDNINHYLNKPITELELVNNGFYKYLYTDTIKDEDNINGSIGTVFKFELYSNVKPQKQKDEKLYPVPIFKLNQNLDKTEMEERIRYIVDDLDDRIITYFFINDTLTSKSIYVFSMHKNKKHITDFTTKDKIIKYYDSLKIPIKPIIDGKMSTIAHPTLFIIDNYKTSIYYYEHTDIAYDIFTAYDNIMPHGNILSRWYSGSGFELSE